MQITLYTNRCPCCEVLEATLKATSLDFEAVTDTGQMLAMGIPALVPEVGQTVSVDFGMFDLDFPCPGVATVRIQWAATDTVDTDPSQWGSMTFCE